MKSMPAETSGQSDGPRSDPVWSESEREQLTRIATDQSVRSGRASRKQGSNEKIYTSPELDPTSNSFDLALWMKAQLKAFEDGTAKPGNTGVIFKNMAVHGSGAAVKLQQTVGSVLSAPLRLKAISESQKTHKTILQNFDGLVKRGEMLLVLGRPGAGCSTFLKSIAATTDGLKIDEAASIHYDGIPPKIMKNEFKGEILYNQEVEKHFPHLTVGQTLAFAAAARTPKSREPGVSRQDFITHVRDVVMAVFGLSHTVNTKVGSDYVPGVSGGERKRVSIAEMALAGAPLCCWDNATRGLDSASALEFVKALQLSSRFFRATHLVAAYQASQAMYDSFDKVMVLYEGREIFFGPVSEAKPFFEHMGWHCPPRQTACDFLTSITNPRERQAKEGFECRVPRTAAEFESYWRSSVDYKILQAQLSTYEEEFPCGGPSVEEFKESKHQRQARHTRPDSPYTISIPMQVRLCTTRAYQRIWNDKTSTITTVGGNIFMSLIIASLFYGTPFGTQAFFAKSSLLFFAILLNSLLTVTEINALYKQRSIVEKHASYAFYHPFAEALAGVISDITIKLVSGVIFNTITYFLGGLRYDAGAFFIFFLINFAALLSMSAIFRTIAAATRTIPQALAIAGVVLLAVVIYTGFVIPRPNMHPWFKWITWINPLGYAYEALIVNEFHGRDFPCSNVIPAYPGFSTGSSNTFVCGEKGAIPGELFVNGDRYLEVSYGYQYAHLWRNFGILLAFLFFFLISYLVVTELNSHEKSTAESLVFRIGHVPKSVQQGIMDKEAKAVVSDPTPGEGNGLDVLAAQNDIFTWRDVCYDIKIKNEPRRLLDGVSGWVRPGTLTALMGVSGAGKTTLLNVLAQRVSVGVITGDMLVNGSPRDRSFQRKTGYVQQQDLHLHTSTVREALRFSALLRQPKTTSTKEKYEFVEDVIRMLNMSDFAEAVVGTPGEGLNVEQRKLLTIGVELAAKPALLLFFDEPTSGLDSQSSWSIISFLRKLADNGQAVLSTIHQPSAILFEQFDRLLFLAQGGRTVYFGDIGPDSTILLDYFHRNGARKCNESENPAEYILELAGAGASNEAKQDWPAIWRNSPEASTVVSELNRLHQQLREEHARDPPQSESQAEFATPFWDQLVAVTIRVFQQYWRTPTYIYGKYTLGIASALFVGFSFYLPGTSIQGLQSFIFAIFMITAIFAALVQQVMPQFIFQRDLYEVRERPSKTYHWAAFMIANILVEIPYSIFLGILVFAAFSYPVFGITSSEYQGLVLLLCVQFFVFGSTFAHMVVSGLPDAETAGEVATLLFYLTLIFNGVLLPRIALPGFWTFMYRVSPMTYIVNVIATAVSGRRVECASNELNIFQPPPNTTCGQYMERYLQSLSQSGAAGTLTNPDATSDCAYCSLQVTDQFLQARDIKPDQRWRNFGLVWVYIAFNILAAVSFYYLFRVRRWKKH
ncbi:uncharacterized protein Z518_08657 [Rhinocladiella mackenziei CBS 650.93]|uniref:ABC transporter domain-containing protein n=1 Tax=Rhinocladiella mackenziei CBS 650.93 TaxID=1442369 RepID=A0A0D2J1D6_9EURO|nr:uncharacterized protein Z518_08657 [Rhinocladiella mackenziei CBS 650.93]KIX02715.1 hypothetical protein Z518_08657 [Rhinocladiella mackenziei CBS 650.93]